MQMTILISGASGLVATELILRLLKVSSYRIVLLTRDVKPLRKRYEKYNDRITVVTLDELAGLAINRLLDPIDACVHTAFARLSEGHAIVQSLGYTQTLAGICKDLNVGKFINISSQSVYGNDYCPGITENGECNPSYMYALGKYSSELTCSQILSESVTRLFNIRLSSVCENARFVKVFVDNALNGREIVVTASRQTVSFIDVRDVASALERIILSDSAEPGIYNLGSGDWYDISTVAHTVKSVGINNYFIKDISIITKDNDANPSIGMCIDKFKSTFDWRPTYRLEDMIDSIYQMLTDVNGGGYPISFRIVYGL